VRGLGRPTLVELVQLTALIAQKDPHRRSRACARWLARYLAAADHATIEDACFAASALAALGGPRHETALATLVELVDCSQIGAVAPARAF
jgi:hypothetical protein